MKITTKTDTLLVATCGPRYYGVICGVLLIAFSGLLFSSGGYGYGYGAFILAVGLLFLAISRRWKLTIDKQIGTVTVTVRNFTGLWPRTKTAPTNNISYVNYDSTSTSAAGVDSSTVSIEIVPKDQGTIQFGASRPHYKKPLVGMLTSSGKTKELDLAMEIAQFLGVNLQNM